MTSAIIEISRNGYAFSDGCGVMGLNVALKIRKQMGLRDIPGAVQIRLGGVKGMLSLDTDFDSDSIGIRPSMIKFSSRHRVLEVKRVAGGFAKESPSIFTDKIFNQALLVSP
jgi:RNA-dependent RNA polymerase